MYIADDNGGILNSFNGFIFKQTNEFIMMTDAFDLHFEGFCCA